MDYAMSDEENAIYFNVGSGFWLASESV
jgi:hypothetical protein